jgi:predicted ATPase/signal transduction histidine kinase/tRNA A-37 threonylcarbamoyl transferase component Bud32/uncharacterized protein YukE
MNPSISLPGYQITEQLYTGTRTLVYRGIHTSKQHPVVIKILRNEYPNFNELVQFRNQYNIAKNLDFPPIVKPLALETYHNSYALIMEDFGGVSLSDYLKIATEASQIYKSLPLAEFLNIAIQMTDTLNYLYQNRVIHKDIKPANILINSDTKEIQLIDFSISSLLPRETQEIQNANALEGTLAYLSPEQTGRMNRGIDYRSDFYSLGVTFYELLTGKLPFISEDAMELVHCHLAKQPRTIHEINPEIPLVLSEIVSKLMAKNAEDRYQTALGIKSDLAFCLSQLQTTGKIESFEIGKRDISDRFIIPEKLYGRENEVSQLLNAFDRIATPLTKGGQRGVEMMLVAGFSGIGKTAVVNEVHKPIVRQRGYFIKGKYDQFNRNIPFSAFVQAFRDLMGQLLSESDEQLQTWKNQILEAVGDSGQVLIDVIPELENIIGKQPPATELSGSAAQNRFNLLLPKFVQVFTSIEHPLVMFLDDLQWSDSASLNLLKLLMQDTGYLLILGAYRDNEVSPVHPFILTVDEIVKTGATVNTITLPPLGKSEVNQLVADTLNCELSIAQPLTKLVYQKTQGNPFFATQFLKALHDDKLISFDWDIQHWQCDIAQVKALALTDDVVEFMALRLEKLSIETQEILKLAACIGAEFDLNTLVIVSEKTAGKTATALWKALQEGLVIPTTKIYKFFTQSDSDQVFKASANPTYRFLHDRVQQAAYSLIPDDQKQATHYQIGQLLLQQTATEAREERIFELVNQLNYGTSLITEQTEREELAQLNLIACRKARASTAYQATRQYADVGLSLLGETAWQQQYEMTLTLYELAAEVAMLCGDFQQMEQFIDIVTEQAHSLIEQVNVYRIRIQFNASQNKLLEGITIAKQFLKQLGVTFPEIPTPADIQEAIQEIRQLIGERKIEDLIHLPIMTNVEKLAIIQIVNIIMSSAYVCNPALYPLLICFSVKLSLKYGNTSGSAYGYVAYGTVMCIISQDVNTAIEFGQLAVQVISKLDDKENKPRVCLVLGVIILHRKYHIKETLKICQDGYTSGIELGNLEQAGYNVYALCLNAFWCGQFLPKLEEETRAYCHQLVQLNQFASVNWCKIFWQSILNLQGFTNSPGILSGEAIQETELLPMMLSANDVLGLCLFYLHKLMLCFLFGELDSAKNYAIESKRYLMGAGGTVGIPAFYFYDSLTALADLSQQSDEISEALQRVAENQTELQQNWAKYAPMNHQHKVDLVTAEKCRVLGQKTEAIELYEKAIAGAKENEFIQEEALANELAAKFCLTWGKEKFAADYMQAAYYCYAKWGAKAKVIDLEKRYPQLLAPILQQPRATDSLKETIARGTLTSTHSATSISEALDLATLLKSSQAISGEIELDKLIITLLEIVIANAGANKCVLLLKQDNLLKLVAVVEGEKTPQLLPSIPIESSTDVPISLVNNVKRTLSPLVLVDAGNNSQFAADIYLQKHQPKSILSSPIMNKRELIGVLYLENNLTVSAFTKERVEVLNLICAQAAISLENARLYQESQRAFQDLQQAQLQIVQSEKMSALGNLVAGVAHEMNNPLGFISASLTQVKPTFIEIKEHLRLYQETFPNPGVEIEENAEEIDLEYSLEDLPKTLDAMTMACERLKNISTSLRTFSRADKDYKVAFNIHEGIDSTILILKHRLKANEKRPAVAVVTDYGNLPNIQCFPGQLNQVFMNILANAIDALEESNTNWSFAEIKANPNRIKIKTSVENEQVKISIADNGKGMKEEVKQKIFDHLFTTKAVGKGTGLGLAIARQIIEEKHRGILDVNSQLGQGTEFIITLPINNK